MSTKRTLIIPHDNCVDGNFCEAIFRKEFGDNADYLPIAHNNYNPNNPEAVKKLLGTLNLYKDSQVYMADICLPIGWLELLLANGNEIVVIDHHISAIPTVNHFKGQLESGLSPKIKFVFDELNTQSGAKLVWKYFYGDKEVPMLIEYVSDGDIWSFKYKETKWFYAGLLNGRTPNDIRELFERLISSEGPNLLEELLTEGEEIYKQFMSEVSELIPKATPITLLGVNGHMIEAHQRYCSELGAAIARKHGGFALILNEREHEFVSCSLRSAGDLDVSAIASAFGGGGHKNASGFTCANEQALNKLLIQNGNEPITLSR